MISDLASWIFLGQWNAANPQPTYWQSLQVKILVMRSHAPHTVKRARIVNHSRAGLVRYTAMK
jgi:hypothetical protein